MTPMKPYLIRAIYDWILDNDCTPYLLVDAENPGAIVPTAFVQEGRIVLNLRPQAVQNLALGNDEISFSARFGGKPMLVTAPMGAVLALYAQENGRGMVFEPDSDEDPDGFPEPEPTPPPSPAKKKPMLRVVK